MYWEHGWLPGRLARFVTDRRIRWPEIDAVFKNRVDLVTGDTHHLSPEFMEHCPLFGLRVDTRPHLFGGAMFDGDFALVDFVLNIKILEFNMFCALGATCFAELVSNLK